MKEKLIFGPNDKYRITIVAPAGREASGHMSMVITTEDDDGEVWLSTADLRRLIGALVNAYGQLVP